jgi:hydroxyacylglutathione hydrolase
LPDFLEVLPAHGAGSLCGKEIGTRLSSTLGYEKRCNPWLVPQEFDKWQRKLLTDNPSPPKYFSRMKQLNVNGMTSAGHLMPVVMAKESIIDCATCCVIDTRSAEAFAACHLKGSLNIPFLPHFPLWAGGVIPENMEIILVVHLSTEAYPVIQALKLIGIDTIKGICEASHWKCSEGDALLTSSPLLSVNELRNKINDYYVLYVRTPAEWNEGHIDGAYHIELAAVPHSLKEIPQDQSIAVICRSGNRASIAASYLSRNGYQHVVNVKGGMQAWWDSK